MIDVILVSFFLALFYAGFYCGNKFGTVKAMLRSWGNQWRSWLDSH